MHRTRKRQTAEAKALVALEAICGLKTATQLASEFSVHPVQISQWKYHVLNHQPAVFVREPGEERRSEVILPIKRGHWLIRIPSSEAMGLREPVVDCWRVRL